MDIWKDQWMRMEAYVRKEAHSALQDAQSRNEAVKGRFSKDYLSGISDGMRRAAGLIEAFRLRIPKNEMEQKIEELREFTLDEEW